MEWYVFREDINGKSIEPYNIFNHYGFTQDVEKMLKEDITKDEFAEQLKKSLIYWFCSKAEHEVVIGSWPLSINKSELERVNAEYDKYGHYLHRINVAPEVGRKIDIYTQVQMNWDVFVDMAWREKNDPR